MTLCRLSEDFNLPYYDLVYALDFAIFLALKTLCVVKVTVTFSMTVEVFFTYRNYKSSLLYFSHFIIFFLFRKSYLRPNLYFTSVFLRTRYTHFKVNIITARGRRGYLSFFELFSLNFLHRFSFYLHFIDRDRHYLLINISRSFCRVMFVSL